MGGRQSRPTAGQTIPQYKYDENIAPAEALPVYTNPDDILEGIQTNVATNVPIPTAQAEGVGALLNTGAGGTSAFDSSVPAEQTNMSPEQVAANQAEYAASNERRFQTPEGQVPNFANERDQLSTGVLQESLQSLTEKVASPENQLGDIKWSPADAGNLESFGAEQANRLYAPDSAYALHMGSLDNLSPQDKAAEIARNAPMLAITGAKLLHNIYNRNYEKQAGNRGSEVIDPYDTDDDFSFEVGPKKKETLNLVEDPVTEVFEAGEPMLNQMITGVTNDLIEFSRAEGEELTQDLKDSSREQGTLFVKDLVDQGQISFARNKRQKIVPVIGKVQTLHRENASKIARLYDIDSRGSIASGIMAPQFPALTDSLFGSKGKKVFLSKKGTVVTTDAAEAFTQLQGSVPIGVNPVLSIMLQQMAEARADKENKTFDSTLSELDEQNVKALIDKHGTEQGLKIVQQKIQLLDKEMADVTARGQDNQPRYMLLKQSNATLRYFHIANNLNLMGQKGTTRATFSFGGTQPIKISLDTGVWNKNAPAIASKVERIYRQNTGKGIARGQEIQRKLYALKKSDPTAFQAMNFYYNLGAQMAKHVDRAGAMQYSRNNFKGRQIHVWTPAEYITYGIAAQPQAAILGKQLMDAVNNKGLTEFANSQGWMRDKGEWQYPSSALIDAYQIASATEGSHITLMNMMESDARTSNAGLISILVDDKNTTSILGLDPSQLDTNGTNLHAGLREKIFDTVSDDVVSVFNGPDDGPYLNSWARLLEGLNKASPTGAAKIYGRGLVVAGLYGKTPQKMYSEAQDFFDKISQLAANSDNSLDVSNAWNEMQLLYGNNKLRMFNDLTDLFTHSMGKHMSKLNGYQNAMRALGGAMAAINSPTSITNMFGGVQELSGDNLSPVLDDTVKAQAFNNMNFMSKEIGGMMIPEVTVQRDYAGNSNVRVDTDQDGNTTLVFSRPGAKQRNAWPVDIIQGGDSTIMTLSVLAMNSPDGGFDGMPVQAVAIHDALVTGPEGHLLATNSYNNIAIPAYAQQAPSVMTSVMDTYNKHLRYVKARHKEGGANIGTQFVGEENSNNSFHGLTGYFDRIYDSVYGADSQAEISNPDLSINNNQSTTYLTSSQLARDENKRKYVLKSNLTKKAILEAAHFHGYLPPTDANLDARKFNQVEGDDFVSLIDIMRASSKMMDQGETLPLALKKAFRELPTDFRPSAASFTYHTIGYTGDSGAAASSGLLRKMTDKSPYRNKVIDSLVNAGNEITHMVPA